MRRQAKPFTVEVKKSKSAGRKRDPISVSADVDTLEKTGHEAKPQSAKPAKNGWLAEFAGLVDLPANDSDATEPAPRKEPNSRILMDLTPRTAPEPESEPAPKRRGRPAGSKNRPRTCFSCSRRPILRKCR